MLSPVTKRSTHLSIKHKRHDQLYEKKSTQGFNSKVNLTVDAGGPGAAKSGLSVSKTTRNNNAPPLLKYQNRHASHDKQQLNLGSADPTAAASGLAALASPVMTASSPKKLGLSVAMPPGTTRNVNPLTLESAHISRNLANNI